MPFDAAEKAQILSQLERLQGLLQDLDTTASPERQQIRDRLWRELEAVKESVRHLSTHDPRD
jgi:hypothetical protein